MDGPRGSRLLSRVLLLGLFVGMIGLESPCRAQDRIARILTGEETDEFESVGIVGSVRRGGFCTGTLITDSHVLTAAHCAEVIDGQTSGTFEVAGEVFLTSEIWIHPQFNSRTLDNDIAILVLSEPVLSVTPSAIFRDEPMVGDILSIVGFGGAGNGNDGSDGTFGTKRVGITTIDDVSETLVSWIFDDISEANTAAGDSGGPGFLDVEGQWYIACITSGGTEPDSSLGDFAFNTRVDAYADWIDETIAFSMMDDEEPPTDEEPPVDEEPPADEEPPVDDDPVDDAQDDSGSSCGSFFSGLFDNYQSSPFPLLQFVIDLFTSLIEWLTGEVAEPSIAKPSIAKPQATQGERALTPMTPSSVSQTGSTTSVAVNDTPISTAQAQETFVAEIPEPSIESTEPNLPATNVASGDFTTGNETAATTSRQTGSGTVDVVEPLPAADASLIEIRRWMIRNPNRRHLVRHRI